MTSLDSPQLRLAEAPDAGERQQRALPFAALLVTLLAGGLVVCVFADGLYAFRNWGVVSLLVLLAVATLVMSGGISFTAPAAAAVAGLLGLAALSALSLAWADSPERAWREVDRLVLYCGVFTLGVALLRGRSGRHALIRTVAALGGAIATVQAARILFGDESIFIEHRLSAPVDYINGSAGFFMMCSWPAIALAERVRHPAGAGLALAAAVLEANLLILTQSRAIVPALLGSAVVLLAVVPGRTVRIWALILVAACVASALPWTLDVFRSASPGSSPGSHVLRSAGAAAIASALLGAVAWGGATALRARAAGPRAARAAAAIAVCVVVALAAAAVVRVGDPRDEVRSAWRSFTANSVDTTASVRFGDASGFRHDLWGVAWHEFAARPLGGVGAGSYGLRYFALRHNPESVRQPHSLELQMLAELGVGGALALVVCIAGVLWGLARSARRQPFVAVACGGLFLTWLIHTSVDWLWNLPALTCIALFAAAALVNAGRHEPGHARWSRPLAAAVLIVIACATASLARQYAGERYRESAQRSLAADPAAALATSRHALEYTPGSMDALYTRAAAYARVGAYRQARAALLEATHREPRNFVPWALLGDIATRRGDVPAARHDYARALALNPREPSLRLLARGTAAP